jgi:hypothetical protein
LTKHAVSSILESMAFALPGPLSPALSAAALLLAAAACTSSPTAPSSRVDPIQIDAVEIQVLETAPPQVRARVTGVVGDGCSELKSVTQVRSEATVTLTILRERPVDAICTQIARLYDETIPLEGAYPAGQYLLRVNGREFPFATR